MDTTFCYIPTLPDDRQEEAARRAARANRANVPLVESLTRLSPRPQITPYELATTITKYWGAGGVQFSVDFLDGEGPLFRNQVLSHMNAWAEYCNVLFFHSTVDPRVRITTQPGNGYWSYLGTDVDLVPNNEPTMSLSGFTTHTHASVFTRVVRHEAGHTLGFPHEHLREEIVDKIDYDAALKYYAETQNWNAAETQRNVLDPLKEGAILATSEPDERSVMCYWLPAKIMTDGEAVLGGADISPEDARYVARLYPRESSARLALANFGYEGGGWRVEKHPRVVADVTGNGRGDIVGFGEAGVWVALSNGDGTFGEAKLAVANFGYDGGGWRVEKHPRVVADVTGNGRGDIVGFGEAGVWVALSNGDGTFGEAKLAVANFGYEGGGWRVEKHPRVVADVTGNGCGDIVGFGEAGVWVALSNGDGTFGEAKLAVANFGYDGGGWRVEKHPRVVADVTGNGRGDIVGFGEAGVWVALSNGDGTFGEAKLAVANFGYDGGGWRVEKHPRVVADVTGNGRGDIVGFGEAGVWVALSNGDGTFGEAKLAVANFGYDGGGWRVEKHPRVVADVTGNGRGDIVGFGEAGVWVALSNGDGTFERAPLAVANFGYDGGGWRVEKHPRVVADVTGNGQGDIVGFGQAGVWVALSRGNGTF